MRLPKRFLRAFTDVQSGTEYLARIDDSDLISYPDTAVSAGLALLDSADNKVYLVIEVDPAYFGRKLVYHKSKIQYAPIIVSISRFTEGDKNAFGRSIDTGLESIATGLPAVFHSTRGGGSIHEGRDRLEETGKTRATVQVCDVKNADRITTDQNETYMVENVNRSELPGFCLLTLIPDKR